MKDKKTPLHFAQQLEAFQTARKAKEVNEVYKFDLLKEGLKQRLLTLDRRMERLCRKLKRQQIESPEIPEEQILREKARTLQELREFEQQAGDAQVNAPDNDFETIAGIQGFRYQPHTTHQELPQFPEARSDAFAHELNGLTEHELRKELELNEKALRDSLKKADRLELSVESAPREPEPQTAPVNQENTENPAPESTLEFTPEPVTASPENTDTENVPKKSTSESSLIYFRSSSPPSDE